MSSLLRTTILTPPTLSPTWRNESAIRTFAGSTPWPIGRQTRDSASSPRSGQNPKDNPGTEDNRSEGDAASPLHKEATPWMLTPWKPQTSTAQALTKSPKKKKPNSGPRMPASIARNPGIVLTIATKRNATAPKQEAAEETNINQRSRQPTSSIFPT